MREKNAKENKLKHVKTQKSIKEQIQNAKYIRYQTAKCEKLNVQRKIYISKDKIYNNIINVIEHG